MQSMTEIREPVHRTYAEPLSGLRVSWGSVLAGTVTMFAVSALLWLLAFAIVMLATHASVDSFKGSVIALWICGIATTLIGAFVGGWVAGALPGNPRRRIGAVHGFVAWGLAMVLATLFEVALVGGMVRGASVALVDAMNAGGPVVDDMAATTPTPGPNAPQNAAVIAIRYGIGAGWTLFGTWAIAMALAVAGGAVGASRGTREERSLERRKVERDIPSSPMTPAPTP